jgi:hypothetical protein
MEVRPLRGRGTKASPSGNRVGKGLRMPLPNDIEMDQTWSHTVWWGMLQKERRPPHLAGKQAGAGGRKRA